MDMKNSFLKYIEEILKVEFISLNFRNFNAITYTFDMLI
jgi:hypothetical protein